MVVTMIAVVVVVTVMTVMMVMMMIMLEREKKDPSKSFNAGLTTCTGR